MPTAGKAPARRVQRTRKPSNATPDAVQLLTADHREVKQLFQHYQTLVDHEAPGADRQALAEEICAMLTVHTTLEEEIFYPAARAAIREPALIDEANVEHASAKELIAQIQASGPDEALYDAQVKVLSEYIDHHVKEEEQEIFPQARKAKMDLAALGEQLGARKGELMAEVGLGEETATA